MNKFNSSEKCGGWKWTSLSSFFAINKSITGRDYSLLTRLRLRRHCTKSSGLDSIKFAALKHGLGQGGQGVKDSLCEAGGILRFSILGDILNESEDPKRFSGYRESYVDAEEGLNEEERRAL